MAYKIGYKNFEFVNDDVSSTWNPACVFPR